MTPLSNPTLQTESTLPVKSSPQPSLSVRCTFPLCPLLRCVAVRSPFVWVPGAPCPPVEPRFLPSPPLPFFLPLSQASPPMAPTTPCGFNVYNGNLTVPSVSDRYGPQATSSPQISPPSSGPYHRSLTSTAPPDFFPPSTACCLRPCLRSSPVSVALACFPPPHGASPCLPLPPGGNCLPSADHHNRSSTATLHLPSLPDL